MAGRRVRACRPALRTGKRRDSSRRTEGPAEKVRVRANSRSMMSLERPTLSSFVLATRTHPPAARHAPSPLDPSPARPPHPETRLPRDRDEYLMKRDVMTR